MSPFPTPPPQKKKKNKFIAFDYRHAASYGEMVVKRSDTLILLEKLERVQSNNKSVSHSQTREGQHHLSSVLGSVRIPCNTFDMEPFGTLHHVSVSVRHQTRTININILDVDFLWPFASGIIQERLVEWTVTVQERLVQWTVAVQERLPLVERTVAIDENHF